MKAEDREPFCDFNKADGKMSSGQERLEILSSPAVRSAADFMVLSVRESDASVNFSDCQY
jgi:hypothetical protein